MRVFPYCPLMGFIRREWWGIKKEKETARRRFDSGQHRRILAITAVLGLLAFAPVAVRLWDLMVSQHSRYSRLALDNQTRITRVTAHRGTVYDQNMNVLAQSQTVQELYLDPLELKQAKQDTQKISAWLAQLLHLDADWILQQAGDTSMRYKRIASDLDAQVCAQIRSYIHEQKITGVHLEPSSRRVYPYGTLASQVLGFTNRSNTGAEGLEASYNSFLEGDPGSVITTKGNRELDMPFSYEAYLQANQGCSLILTLDATVQACLENRMQEAIDRYQVQNGAFGLVMEAKTGRILAMATLGNYDPNQYLEILDEDANLLLAQLEQDLKSKTPGTEAYETAKAAYDEALSAARLKQWRNRVISDGYEPGSTFKVLTMAAALDAGAIDLNTSFYCRGAEQIPGRAQLLHCWRSTGHGSEQTPQALQNSCNIAFAHIALDLGGPRFYEYMERFGVMEKTGIDLAGESKGVFFDKELVTNTEKWGTASLTSGSFGQTFKITPLQLVRAIASVVNGGLLMEPYLVDEVVDARGNTVLKQEPTVVRRTIKSETSQVMCQLIRSVVTEGTAKNAAVSGYDIGGKTGTSEKIDVFDENGQRVTDKIVSFVGIAPMNDPAYIVLVALDTPSRETGIYISGGVMAAPTVGAVMADILPYLEVEKAREPEMVLPDVRGMTLQEAEKVLKPLGLTPVAEGSGDLIFDQLPGAGQMVRPGTQVLVYVKKEPTEGE